MESQHLDYIVYLTREDALVAAARADNLEACKAAVRMQLAPALIAAVLGYKKYRTTYVKQELCDKLRGQGERSILFARIPSRHLGG